MTPPSTTPNDGLLQLIIGHQYHLSGHRGHWQIKSMTDETIILEPGHNTCLDDARLSRYCQGDVLHLPKTEAGQLSPRKKRPE